MQAWLMEHAEINSRVGAAVHVPGPHLGPGQSSGVKMSPATTDTLMTTFMKKKKP